ncbi:zinc-binding protein A33-like [Anoplopoma fimbria]|uniref:zinc-binding protein A33-like n=1 Tax=Anoplopoma fimbria TaxID=229290 RepID=UPI0023EB0D10|nr:zinc-binding protein A33-like [Anoplopoma fimbria]
MADDADSFLCSICQDVFTKPVSIPCGHNFCLDCITNYWDNTDTVMKCPLCKENFFTRPMLRVNTVIAEMAAKFNKSERSLVTPEKAGSGYVLCDWCTGAKLPATKSCLGCFLSFCETHLKPHQNSPAMKNHKLIHPVENLKGRMCKTHDALLELFCKADQMFVCESCKVSDHKAHNIVNLEDEAQIRKSMLGREKESTDEKIQSRQQRIHEIEQSVEASRINAANALSYSMHAMTALVDYIRRSQAGLAEVIETKQKKIEMESNGLIKELEGEIMQLKQIKSQLSQVAPHNDDFLFLENFLSLAITQPQVKNWSDVTLNSYEFTEQGAMAMLETTVTKEIRMLCDPDWKEMQQHAVDVTLDPDTANPLLVVSPDGKQVTHGDRRRQLPKKPGRFEQVLNVLAKEGFSSGKFYYEVQVKDKTNWDLGVANQSINRKGDIRLSPKIGYWTIYFRKGSEFTANAGPAINLNVREVPQKVGVFVDYEAGQVSFHDADSRACIFSFTGWNFTEKLFPFFSPCGIDGNRNSAPLIITPVKHNS